MRSASACWSGVRSVRVMVRLLPGEVFGPTPSLPSDRPKFHQLPRRSPVEDVGEHGPGVQIDAAVESVLAGVAASCLGPRR